VDEAIRLLAEYVAVSIAIGVRMLDVPLLSSLPGLLEPFIGFSPLLEAIWQNARATVEGMRDGCWERARERWLGVYQRLGDASAAELQHVEAIRNAVAYAIGMSEIGIGLPTAATWAARLDADPTQRVSAMYLRKIVRLEQGDFAGADRAQRQAEVLALQARAPQMFDSLLYLELYSYTHARDLSGVKNVLARIEPLASRSPAWEAVRLLAQGRFALVRDDFEQALVALQRCCELGEQSAKDGSGVLLTWIEARGSLAETLLALGRVDQALACASDALAVAEPRGLDAQANDLVRMRALAQAKLGAIAQAQAELETLIAKQETRGVSGLKLGLSYEARARVALVGGDGVAFERYALRAAREYGRGRGSPLSMRHARLCEEARRSGLGVDIERVERVPSSVLKLSLTDQGALDRSVKLALLGARDTSERALRALRLICDARAAHVAHCYLLQGFALEHIATFGPHEPPAALCALTRDFLRREESRAEIKTVAATRVVSAAESQSESRAEPLVRLGGELYELMQLSCIVEGRGVCVGAIALLLPPDAVPARPAHQAQILSAIASQFLPAQQPAQGSNRL
jgi:tetratricopeptide (TPR) repeat protein